MHRRFSRVAMAAAAALLALLAGCAGPQKSSNAPVFFPPPPNLPRLQFLTGFSTSPEVTQEKDTVSLFTVGKEKQNRIERIIKPSGIATRGGKLYVADMSGQLLVVDLPRKTMERFKGDQGLGKLKKPLGVAVDPSGVIFVADAGRKEVLAYDANGEFLKVLANENDLTPTDVAVYDGELYVLDTRKQVITVFDPESGSVKREIGKLPEREKSVSLPTKMSIDGRGVIRVSNAGRGDITSYDRDGHFLSGFGKFGDGLGQFSRPKGLTADQNGYIYVVDAAFQNVQVFNESGRLLTYFGSAKLPTGGMNLPCDVSTSTDDIQFYQSLADKNFEVSEVIFVANQFGDPKISLYALGKQRGVDYDKVYRKAAEERDRKAQEKLKRMKEEKPAEKRDAEPAAEKQQLSRAVGLSN